MASVAPSQNWASEDVFEGIKISGVDSDILMSLMEELHDHVDESDEERLKSVIQSLEAEINSSSISLGDQDSCTEQADYPDHQSLCDGEDSQTCSSGQLDGHDCRAPFDQGLDMNAWIDMEAVPCSPSNDLNWYFYPCEDEMHSSCFVHDNYLGDALDDQEHGYNYLWKETTCDSMMYD